jgi:hypothetical protein
MSEFDYRILLKTSQPILTPLLHRMVKRIKINQQQMEIVWHQFRQPDRMEQRIQTEINPIMLKCLRKIYMMNISVASS